MIPFELDANQPPKKVKAKYDYEPDYALLPGDFLLETLKELDLTMEQLSERSGISIQVINEIIAGTGLISQDIALSLEKVTGIPSRIWNNLESNYRS